MQIIINLPDDLIARITQEPNPHGHSLEKRIEIYLEAGFGQPAKAKYASMSMDEMVALAVETMRQHKVGERCTLQSLLVDQAWDILSDGDKRQLGRLVRAKIEGSGLATFERNSSNLAIYTRTAHNLEY
ncbi:hypothetical protein [Delftia tsuruhatensis]|uniref:hypothetical protein n=1 Tax=Delftia tsuruhatensis TaxID=180282 RepID=UPI002AD48E05|nr:hypothetical protein [Delftia tsuruhatensis]WQM81712.1 hypothetical protein RNT40_23835 [Delftia tsuruhatensis]